MFVIDHDDVWVAEKLHKQISNSKLTFHSTPVSDEIADGYYVTNDGYVAENLTIIDKGILKTPQINGNFII